MHGPRRAARLRRLNRRLELPMWRDATYDGLIRELLAQEVLVSRDSIPVRLPPDRFDHAEAELTDAGGRGIHPPLAEQLLVRVDSHAQPAELVDSRANPLAEPRHERASRSAAFAVETTASSAAIRPTGHRKWRAVTINVPKPHHRWKS